MDPKTVPNRIQDALKNVLRKMIENWSPKCWFLIDFGLHLGADFPQKSLPRGGPSLTPPLCFWFSRFFTSWGYPLAPIWSILGRFLVHFDPDLTVFRHQQATAKQLQQSTSQKQKPQNNTTAIHPSFHAHNLSRSSASGTWLAEGLVGSREAIRIKKNLKNKFV